MLIDKETFNKVYKKTLAETKRYETENVFREDENIFYYLLEQGLSTPSANFYWRVFRKSNMTSVSDNFKMSQTAISNRKKRAIESKTLRELKPKNKIRYMNHADWKFDLFYNLLHNNLIKEIYKL